MELRKTEIKLFISFFIIYSLFAHWTGWNESSSFSLTKAVVNEGRLEIDNYINETVDRSYFDGKYYISSSPGLGFISLPIFSTLKFWFNMLGIYGQTSCGYMQFTFIISSFPICVNPGPLILTSMVASTILTSGIFGALSVLVFYHILGMYTKVEKYKIVLSLVFGLGSLAFPLGLFFHREATLLFFVTLSFYFLKRGGSFSKFLYSGIFLGFSIFIEYSALLLVPFFIVLCFKYSSKNLKWLLLGGIIGLIPLFLYSSAVYRNPFAFSLLYVDQNIWLAPNIGSRETFNPNVLDFSKNIWPLSFGTYRGLFFYYPIFLLSLIGLFYFWKKHKLEALVFLLIFIAFLIANSSWVMWWGGANFGSRFLALVTPFLILPLVSLLESRRKNKIFLLVFIVLLMVSTFHNFLGLEDTESAGLAYDYQKKQVEVLEIYPNPIYDHYLPLFLKNGPRSRILEGLLTYPIRVDIRDWVQQPTSEINFILTPFGFLTFKPQILPIALIAIISFLIWKKEIIKLIPNKYFFLLCLALLVTLFLALDVKVVNYGENWYPIYRNETFTDTYRWVSDNATVYLFSRSKADYILNFSWVNYNASKNLELYLNGNFLGNSNNYYVGKKIELNPGENILLLKPKEGCYVPAKMEPNSSNFNCLSFGIGNFSLYKFDDLEMKNAVVFGDNWYPIYRNETFTDPYRWMSQNGTVYLFSSEKTKAILSFSFLGYGNRAFDIVFNNKTIDSYSTDTSNRAIEVVELNSGENILLMYSREGCSVPPEFPNVCSSIGVSDFQVLRSEDLKTNRAIWDRNWFDEEKNENMSYRWMSNNATIYLVNPSKEPKQVNLTSTGWSYYKPRTLQFLIGDYSQKLNFLVTPQKISGKLILNPGINILKIASEEGCDTPARIENSTDDRCLSFALGNLSINE